MKYKKKIVLIVLLSLIGVLFFHDVLRILFSSFYLNEKYTSNIPVSGNTSNYVPQGLAYSSRYNVILQTSYNSEHRVSMLYVRDFTSGELLKSIQLKMTDGNDNTHHVGGIATNEEIIWITNDYEVEEYSLQEVVTTKKKSIRSQKHSTLPIRGDFCYYDGNFLWIGDFCLSPFYKVPDNIPLLFQYRINELDYQSPNLIISLPKMVQGMVITKDSHFIFTRSFTNLIQSSFDEYQNVLTEKPEKYSFNGKDIPYYHFTKENLISTKKLPPMAEGLFLKDDSYYILFENSSNHYFYAFPKFKNIMKLKR